MRISNALVHAVSLLGVSQAVLGASSWTFSDATVSVQGKGSGVGSGSKENLSPKSPLTKPFVLGASDTLKVVLTTKEGKTSKRPQQASLLLRDPATDLDVTYPLSTKESGKGKIDLSHRDLPLQFLRKDTVLSAYLILASTGDADGYYERAFSVGVKADPTATTGSTEKPLRYGKLPEIHHIFRSDPKSPNFVIVAFFTVAAAATLPVLLGLWLQVGGNLNHLSKALSDAPVSHALFFGSIVGIEGIFFLYYTVWNLFQTLPALAAVGIVAYISGSRALTEVQDRRLAGLR
ncbi:uncharacterized protein AB675_582 [Cyphellophora attinorum]|uniref:Ribophorin II C-terminal domain-containing protein n=1 Tax=Cyphellophora attinorum TaxID=1664694 RepID=A0A0N1HYG5_9EURO|nr:uncharacterized protein AB675_582 [Phialophora attinorum]KPI45872.1 hypothetical protein AB675_582 [Phialophora attinorum]